MSSNDLLQVPVYYDFASTLCYVAHRVMGRMRERLEEVGVELFWTPLDLTVITSWRRGDRLRSEQRDNVLRVSRELDVPLTPPDYWIDSRAAMAIALELGSEERERWRSRAWQWSYEEGRSLEDPESLADLAAACDLDGPLLRPERGLQILQEETERAIATGVHGVPTFLLDIWPIGGIQDEETMLSLLGRWAAKKRAQPGPN